MSFSLPEERYDFVSSSSSFRDALRLFSHVLRLILKRSSHRDEQYVYVVCVVCPVSVCV